MNTTATISPSQRLGELRYAAGVSCAESIARECILKANAVGANPSQTVLQHRGEMRGAERDLLEKRDREKRQDCPKKSRSPRPA